MSDRYRHFPTGEQIDRQNMQSTARASEESARTARASRELIEQLVETAKATEVRERQMLRWTQAGVLLAGIAAVGSIVAIIVTLAVGG